MTDEGTGSGSSAEITERLQSALGDRYVVERELGAGGFALVFLVRDLALKRKLAVKVLSPERIATSAALERFRREAETIAQLTHPNIVPLHFIGESDGLLYLVMAFVDGGSMHDRISVHDTAPMPIDRICRALSEVADALGYAHKRGVVHRDIKPQNVLIDAETGRCLVADFGIARTAEGSSLTSAGVLIGTPAYLAPEQITGEPADHRIDIYALGVMAYEMTTGRQPFEAPTPAAVIMKRLAGPPPPASAIRPEVPAVLDEVIKRCLASDPADRFQRAEEIVAALSSDALAGLQRSSTRAKRPAARREFFGWSRAGVLVVALAAIPVTIWLWPRFARENARQRGAGPGATAASPTRVDTGMVLVPAGEYLVGFDSGAANARPQHRVSLAAFGIDATEVSVGEYLEFIRATTAPAPWGASMPDSHLPVTRVLWTEAMKYCRWRHPSGGDLPSEDQWEAAARGLDHRRYPWGAVFDASAANAGPGGRGEPTRVGSFPRGATPDGIHDLIGNVWEWTRSSMESYPGAPPMPDSMRDFRVIRGGAFNSPKAIATVWVRGYNRPAASRDQFERTGFRCVMPSR